MLRIAKKEEEGDRRKREEETGSGELSIVIFVSRNYDYYPNIPSVSLLHKPQLPPPQGYHRTKKDSKLLYPCVSICAKKSPWGTILWKALNVSVYEELIAALDFNIDYHQSMPGYLIIIFLYENKTKAKEQRCLSNSKECVKVMHQLYVLWGSKVNENHQVSREGAAGLQLTRSYRRSGATAKDIWIL